MQAMTWYLIAKASGTTSAANNLQQLEAISTPAQIAEAQRLAHEWRASHPITQKAVKAGHLNKSANGVEQSDRSTNQKKKSYFIMDFIAGTSAGLLSKSILLASFHGSLAASALLAGISVALGFIFGFALCRYVRTQLTKNIQNQGSVFFLSLLISLGISMPLFMATTFFTKSATQSTPLSQVAQDWNSVGTPAFPTPPSKSREENYSTYLNSKTQRLAPTPPQQSLEDRAQAYVDRVAKGQPPEVRAQTYLDFIHAETAGSAPPINSEPGFAIPAPPSTPRPSVITNCDSAGCWDDVGGRYDRGAGDTYFGPSGAACQMVGGMMQCP